MDLAHLRRIHGYDSVKRIESISVDGPCLESCFDFRTTRKIAGIATLTLDFLHQHACLWAGLLVR